MVYVSGDHLFIEFKLVETVCLGAICADKLTVESLGSPEEPECAIQEVREALTRVELALTRVG